MLFKGIIVVCSENQTKLITLYRQNSELLNVKADILTTGLLGVILAETIALRFSIY
jgi:hypothetical protein